MIDKIFTAPVGTVPSVDVIKQAIDFNERLLDWYNKNQNYYFGRHDILNRQRLNTRINNKVVVNMCKYITDVNVGYLLGNPVKYQGKEGKDVSMVVKEYERQTIADEDNRIAKGSSIYGRQYEYTFVGEGNKLMSTKVDNKNCIVVYDDSFEHKKLFAILYNKVNRNRFSDIVVLDAKEQSKWVNGEGKIAMTDEKTEHKLDKVPVVEFRNNDDLMGDFEQIIPLNDALNLLQSDRVNDKEQLVDAIMLIKNMELTDALREELKIYRTLSNVPLDAEIEFLVKNLDEGQLDIFRKNIVDDIHKISMTPNLSDENFVGNASGVAIKYKLLGFEQAVMNKERAFERGLMERFELYNLYLNKLKGMPIIETHEVDALFNRNLPQNDYEVSMMINNLVGLGIPQETLIGLLSFVDNPEEEMKLAEEEAKDSTKVENKEYGTNKANESEEETEDEEVE